MARSTILDKKERLETGRKLFVSSTSRPSFLSSGRNNATFSEVTKMHSSKYLLTKGAIKEAAASNATVTFETLIGSSEQYVLLISLIYLRMLNLSIGLNFRNKDLIDCCG